jgi:hypothetical protein
MMNTWGTSEYDGLPSSAWDAGWLPEMSRNEEAVEADPAKGDGLYYGASRGHTIERYARLIGVPRAYGYGASMGAWVLDYVGNWAGELGLTVHSNVSYRHPPLIGDVTYLDAEVESTAPSAEPGKSIAQLRVVMTTQTGVQMARGTVEVLLPDR